MKVYFLDRNIISLIKESNLGKLQSDKNKLFLLKKLREVDTKYSIITPMLSVIEGAQARLQSEEEIKKILYEELSACENFFKNAQIDKQLILLLPDLIEGFTSKSYQDKINLKIKFLSEVNSFIFQPVKAINRNGVRDKVLEISEKYKLGRESPVVFSVLLCIYNNKICQKILKPKKEIPNNYYYNAVMDFQSFYFFSFLSMQIKPKKHSEFITGDKNLNNFFKFYDIKSSYLLSDGQIIINSELSKFGESNMPLEIKKIFEVKR